MQLPIYHPSEAEKKDAKLYAANVRELLLREGGMKPSDSTLADCRAYISMLQVISPTLIESCMRGKLHSDVIVVHLWRSSLAVH